MDAIEILPVSNGFIVREARGWDDGPRFRQSEAKRIAVLKTAKELAAFVADFYAEREYNKWVSQEPKQAA